MDVVGEVLRTSLAATLAAGFMEADTGIRESRFKVRSAPTKPLTKPSSGRLSIVSGESCCTS
jgi:hypothetical protein